MKLDVLTWADLHATAVAALGAPHEARWLVEEASGTSWPSCADQPVRQRPGMRFERMLERRRAGEPLQYVLGRWGFRTLDLMVDRRVLIPRPETETVVEVALRELDRLGRPSPIVVDLGTGSGAIALSVAAERPAARVWGTDRSADALDVAAANLAGLGGRSATRVRLVRGDWWEALPAELRGRVDLVVANPPYLSEAELDEIDAGVSEWEPHGALAAGPDGTEDLAAILAGAPGWLAPGGVAVLELAPHQGERARQLAADAGLVPLEVADDLAGRPRALVARFDGSRSR